MCIFPVDIVELVKSQVCCSSRKIAMYPPIFSSITQVWEPKLELLGLHSCFCGWWDPPPPPSCWEGVPSGSPGSLHVCALDRTLPSAHHLCRLHFCLHGGDWASPHDEPKGGLPRFPNQVTSACWSSQLCLPGSRVLSSLCFVFFFPKLVYF